MLWLTKAKHNFTFEYQTTTQHIMFRPLRKIPLSQRRILLVLPHSIFRPFSYHEKSFSGYSKKNLQFQEESDEKSTRANLQPSRVSCSSWLQTANQNTNIEAEVCKVARKRTSGLTVTTWRFLCETKLTREIKGHFLLNKHGGLSFFPHDFGEIIIFFELNEF